MSEQREPMPAAPAGAPEEAPEADPLSLFFEAMSCALGVDTVFGEPITAGDRVIIPVAEASMGGGVGNMYFTNGQRTVQHAVSIPVRSTGGGGGASSRPVAAIIVSPAGVRVQPIIDVSKLALSGMASAAGLWHGLTAFMKALRKR